MREGRRSTTPRQWAALVALAITACSAEPPAETPGTGARVLPGIDVLLRDSLHLVRGRRLGLITNSTGRTADGRSTIDALAAAPGAELVALFAPEHGIRGRLQAGVPVDDERDPVTGLPVHSLYGETRAPTPAMLAAIDVLVFDIQDIGTRYYTYVWTMALALEAAAAAGKRFIVLDRPNPIGGLAVQGNVLDTAWASFVGLYPVPMRHGLTAGELARWLNAEQGWGADLHVVPAEGWQRSLWYDETGLAWTPPSPNMPDLESATHYPGTCLFEGTNLSVGRGTPLAFQQIGAPWLDAAGVIAAVGPLAGARLEAVTFRPERPGDNKYDSTPVNGIRLVVTDRERYDPVHTALSLLAAIRNAHPEELTFRPDHFDRLAGTDRVRTQMLAGVTPDSIMAGWTAELERFRERIEPWLLYR